MRCPERSSLALSPLHAASPRPSGDRLYPRIAALLAALLTESVGCSAPPRDFGSATASSSASSSGSGGGGAGGQSSAASGAADTCPAVHICAVPPAEGWTGPLVEAGGIPAPDCPADYPERAFDVADKVAADPAKCSCACGAPSIVCGPLSVFWRQGCAQAVASDLVEKPDTCVALTPKQVAASAVFKPNVAVPCAPQPTTDLPTPTIESGARLCGGATAHMGCAGSLLCLPKPIAPFSSVCVVRSGDQPCPPGYLNKTLRYAKVNDTRGCSDCTCGPPTGVSCSATFHTYGDSACATPKQDGMTGPSCVAAFSSMKYDPPTVTGSCGASAVEPQGGVELADPYTVCCADPSTLEP